MEFFSLNHSKIGARDRAHAFRDQVRYICRDQAASLVLYQHTPPTGPGQSLAAESWARQHETDRRAARKNARIGEVVKLALPRDTTRDERVEMVKLVLKRVTKHNTPAIAAIHDLSGKDDDNPHVHILIADQHVRTGKRVFGFSEFKSVERLRKTVAGAFNECAERWGKQWRVDHRSFRRQGVPKHATRHEGPAVRALAEKGVETKRGRDNATIRSINETRERAASAPGTARVPSSRGVERTR